MSDEKDNVVRVDFRNRRVLDADSADVPENEDAFPESDDDEERSSAPTKFETFTGLLEHGLVLVTLDTRVPGVDVPAHFRGTPQLHLSFSLRFRVEDFDVDEHAIRATLSFETGSHTCVVPWDAVYGMSSEALDERIAFPESFPRELLAVLPALADLDEELGDDD